MKNPFKTNIEKDMAIISLILSFLFLLVGLFCFIWIDYILYGVIAGLIGIFLSFFLIIFFSKIGFIYNNLVIYSWVKYLTRIGIGAAVFSISIFVINPLFVNSFGVQLLKEPINVIMLIFTYSIPIYSTFLLPIYERIKKKYFEWFNRRNI